MTISLIPALNAKVKARYSAKVAPGEASDCWLWTGGRMPKGYGKFRVGAHVIAAHRVAIALTGQEPGGHIVRHTCDNPPCCNPAHLLLGSVADNSADMISRGRSMRGERHHAAKLQWAQVQEIRESTCSRASLAREFGVKESTIRAVLTGRSWGATVQVNRGAMVVSPEGFG